MIKVPPKPKRRGLSAVTAPRLEEGRSSNCTPGDTIEIFEGAQI